MRLLFERVGAILFWKIAHNTDTAMFVRNVFHKDSSAGWLIHAVGKPSRLLEVVTESKIFCESNFSKNFT